MKKPDIVSQFEFHGIVDVAWYDVRLKDEIPELPWQQVCMVGNLGGRVPVVMYDNAKDCLPGGGVELGESLEEAMTRETKEELNMSVVAWEPLGYQVCTRRDTGEVSWQFRAYAQLEVVGEFTNDLGGGVIGYRLIELDELNSYAVSLLAYG